MSGSGVGEQRSGSEVGGQRAGSMTGWVTSWPDDSRAIPGWEEI